MLALMSSCRTMKKNKTQADSTVVRSEQTAVNWERVTVTEVFGQAKEPSAVRDEHTAPAVTLSSVEGPSTKGLRQAQPDKGGLLKKLFKKGLRSKQRPQAQSGNGPVTLSLSKGINPVPQFPLLARTTTTERGTFSQQKQEQKQVHTAEKTKEVESGLAINKWLLPGAVILIVLVVICLILLRSKKRDN